MDDKKQLEIQEALQGEASEPKQEERCKLAKDEVDGVTGGRPPYTFRRSRRKKWPSRVHSLPPNELCEQAVLGYELVVRATLCDSSIIEDQYPVAMSDGR